MRSLIGQMKITGRLLIAAICCLKGQSINGYIADYLRQFPDAAASTAKMHSPAAGFVLLYAGLAYQDLIPLWFALWVFLLVYIALAINVAAIDTTISQ